MVFTKKFRSQFLTKMGMSFIFLAFTACSSGGDGQAPSTGSHQINGSVVNTIALSTQLNVSNDSGTGYIAVDSSGYVYISSINDGTIKKIAPNGTVSVFVSSVSVTGIVIGKDGNLYGDRNGDILKISPSGAVTVLATSSDTQITNDSSTGSLAVSDDGTVYAVSMNTATIKKITSSGVVSDFASSINAPAIVMGKDGYLYAYGNDASISKISPTGVVTIVASGSDTNISNDSNKGYIAIDDSGNVYASSSYGGSPGIRKITPQGVVTNLVNSISPLGLVVGSDGYLYVYATDLLKID